MHRHKPGNQSDSYRRCNHHEVGFQQGTVILASPAATTALGVALNGNLYTITPDPKQSTSEALEALGTAITDKDFHVTVINDTIVIEAVDETSSNTLVLSET